jgi:DNA ligase (NAD+)
MTKNLPTSSLAIFETSDGSVKVDVRVLDETVWLSLNQISEIFGRDKSVIAKHIKNIFREEELEKNSVVAFFATTAQDGKVYEVEHFNLDAIISVGYRVNSKRGVQFRQWASKLLKEYLVKGYNLNKEELVNDKLKELQDSIDLISKTLANNALVNSTGKEVIEIIKAYSKTWDLLIRYDENNLELPQNVTSSKSEIISYECAIEYVESFKSSLFKSSQGEEGLFGIEREDGLRAILGNIMQSFGGEYLYPSIEEKAAHLLYFIIKDHPFSDGNKRIGSFLFLLYLKMVGISLDKINENTITALALLVAESHPDQKELMIKLIMHILT